jgi:FixJ family two-component response regulator
MYTDSDSGKDRSLVRIAVVDDDDDIVTVLGEVMKRAEYVPDLFSCSSDARLAATSQEYDVVIADLQMPEVDGIQLLTAVKNVFPLSQFIMITGYADVRTAVEAMHQGAVSYLTKPLTSSQILAHVEKALERRLLALDNQRLIYELTNANQSLKNKVEELKHMNELLTKTQKDLVEAERLAAIGEVVVSINHAINNSVSGIKAAVRFVRHLGIEGESVKALAKIDDECTEIEAVVARLNGLRNTQSTEYVDGIRMTEIESEEEVHAGS